MKKLFLTSIAALFLATGAAQAGATTKPNRVIDQQLTRMAQPRCSRP